MTNRRDVLPRDPGAEIKKILRQEVNFGCPVRFDDGNGCGCPILTYHHFAPPFSEAKIHDPEGMIALCPEHHHQADGGQWANQQLREMKVNPYIDSELKIRWPWTPESIVLKVGRNLVVQNGAAIRLDGNPVIYFEPNQIPGMSKNVIATNSKIHKEDGSTWIEIEDGWFDLRLENTTDVVFTPQANFVTAKHADEMYLTLRMKHFDLDQFVTQCESFLNERTFASLSENIDSYGIVDSDERVSFVEVTGKFSTKKLKVELRSDRIILEWSSGMPIFDGKDKIDTSLIVSGTNRLTMVDDRDGTEFFGIG